MKKFFLFIVIIIVAQNTFSQRIAKYAGEFISIGVGGRALGLGGAYCALADDASAGYWNPAALCRVNFPEIILMHDERFGGLLNYDFGAVVIPFGLEGSFGVSLMRLGVDGIPDSRKAGVDAAGNYILNEQFQNFVNIDYDRITYFNSADWAMYLTYANRFSNGILYGINLKVLRRTITEFTAHGIGFDVGAFYSLTDNWFIAANLQDITTTLVSWSNGTNELISPTLKFGTAYYFELFSGRIAPTVDVDMRFENRKFSSNVHLGPISLDPHFGLEYDFKKSIALRIGYSDVRQITLGAGLHLRKLEIDYSFARFSKTNDLGDTHRISIRLILQHDKFARPMQ
jgi:hypothetical protein